MNRYLIVDMVYIIELAATVPPTDAVYIDILVIVDEVVR